MIIRRIYKQLIVVLLLSIGLPISAQGVGAYDTEQKLSFNKYLQEVTENNLQFLAEKYNVDIAKAEIAASKVMPDPNLTFEASKDSYNAELTYDLELGKRRMRVKNAKLEKDLAVLELEAFFQELRAEATHAFLDAIFQRDLLKVKRNSYDNMVQLHKSDSIRYQLGEINENDARQSKVEAVSLLNEVYEQEAAFKSAYVLLNKYMGKRIGSIGFPDGNMDNLQMNLGLDELMNIALKQRIDVIVANKGIDVAQSKLKLAKVERRADLGLMVGYERDWHGMWPNKNTIKGGVTIPLKFSNMNRGVVNSSKLAIQQSHVMRESKEMDAQIEVSQAFFEYEAAQNQVRQYDNGLLAESRKVLDGTIYKYRRGESAILDVLIAQRTYNEVHEQYLQVLKNYASALVNLELTCGMWDIEL